MLIKWLRRCNISKVVVERVVEFKILDLTNNDDNYWRIDWFGTLSYFDGRGQRRSEPLVTVYLSKLYYSPWKSNINYKSSTDYWNPHVVSVPIEYLKVLYIGDIWHHGKLVMSPKYEEYNYASIITPQNTSTILASSKDKSGDYYVSFERHPYHNKAPYTFCEVVSLNFGKRLIFPHWVILQAYFSSCSFVFRQLFQFGLQLNTLYDPNKSSLEEGNGKIQLKKWVHDLGAPELARIAWDKSARNAYTMVSANLAINKSNNKPLTPKTKFPFSDHTEMTVKGKHLQDTGSEDDPFIVFGILSCSAKYPYNQLSLVRDNPGKTEHDKGYQTKYIPASKPTKNKPRVESEISSRAQK